MSEIRKEVKLVLKKSPYNRGKHWYIPIAKTGENSFNTGQDLTYRKMSGLDSLTDEERSKYPYVINPDNTFRFVNGHKFFPEESKADEAIMNLMKISGRIAPSETEWEINRQKYDGYLFDAQVEAEHQNRNFDIAFDAEIKVRSIRLDEYLRYTLLFNYIVPGASIPVKGQTTEYVRHQFLKLAREFPTEVLRCFSKEVDSTLFILELIHYNILAQNPKKEIYEGKSFLASNIEELKRMFTREQNMAMVNKFAFQLDTIKGVNPDVGNMTLEQLQKMVRNPKNSVYKKSEYESIIEDREALLDYINSKK